MTVLHDRATALARRRRIVIGMALSAAAFGLASPSAAPNLDGTSWQLDVSPDRIAQEKGIKTFTDTLSFASGKLATNAGRQQGFPEATYTASRSGASGWSFTAEQKAAREGSCSWDGTVRGEEMRGVLIWTKPDRSVLTYTFRGSKRRNE